MPAIDVELARSLTPGCERVVHLNNAGASLPPTPVLDTVIGHLRREAEIGGYEAYDEAADRYTAVYDSIARLVGAAGPDEIALVENATRAWDMAFYAFDLRPGDRVVTGRAEYASNVLAMLQVAQRTGARIDVIDDDEHGQIDVGALRMAMGDDVRLLALTHVPTNGGLVNPAAEVGAVAREHGVPFLLDACQSMGQLPVDVDELGCDALCATGRKFLRGPRGTGFLYVRRELAERLHPPFVDLHAAEWTGERSYELASGARRFETWEGNVAAKLGLGAAVDHALGWGLDAIAARIGGLAEELRTRLAELEGVDVHDAGLDRCGIVTFTVDGISPATVRDRLRAAGVNTSVSTVGHARLDLPRRGLGDVVRASVHYFNTERELDTLVSVVAAVVAAP